VIENTGARNADFPALQDVDEKEGVISDSPGC
jgi:hypothetical protein